MYLTTGVPPNNFTNSGRILTVPPSPNAVYRSTAGAPITAPALRAPQQNIVVESCAGYSSARTPPQAQVFSPPTSLTMPSSMSHLAAPPTSQNIVIESCAGHSSARVPPPTLLTIPPSMGHLVSAPLGSSYSDLRPTSSVLLPVPFPIVTESVATRLPESVTTIAPQMVPIDRGPQEARAAYAESTAQLPSRAPVQMQAPATQDWPTQDDLSSCESLDGAGFRAARARLNSMANSKSREYDERLYPWRELALIADIENVYGLLFDQRRFEYDSEAILNSLDLHTQACTVNLVASTVEPCFQQCFMDAMPGKTAVWYYLTLMASRAHTHQKAYDTVVRLERYPGWAQVLVFNDDLRGRMNQVFGKHRQDVWSYYNFWGMDPKLDPRDDWIRHWKDRGHDPKSYYDFKSGLWVWDPISDFKSFF